MNYVVAVSGGVDSMVLLDMIINNKIELSDKRTVIVAHFDHGIRADSAADARFVEGVARTHGLPFEMRREELGAATSEAMARERRYMFLRNVAAKHKAIIVTAHHINDLVETVAINLKRGTGWRGLAVLNSKDVIRPLLGMTKDTIYTYALANSIEWVEDESNKSNKYYRNRVRKVLQVIPYEYAEKVANLRSAQVHVASEIDKEIELLSSLWKCRRYPYRMADEASAIEVLRAQCQARLTRPRLRALLLAIKTAKAGTKFEAGSGVLIHFSLDEFSITVV